MSRRIHDLPHGRAAPRTGRIVLCSVIAGVLAMLLTPAPAFGQADRNGVVNDPLRGGGAIHIRVRTEPLVPDESLLPRPEELDAVRIDPSLRVIVQALGSPMYDERERAMSRLLEMPLENIQLYAVLERESLEPEQRQRILAVLQERLLNAPRGAVGIRMQPQALGGRQVAEHVEVIELIPGLPAERLLQVGDRITHLDGERLQSAASLTSEVQSRRPGDKVRLSVLRIQRDDRGRPHVNELGDVVYDALEIELTLGSADKLVDPRTGQPAVSPEEHRRAIEAAAALKRYAVAPRVLTVDGELSIRGTASHGDPELDRLVEQDLRIQSLKRQVDMLRQGQVQNPDELIGAWRSQRQLIEAQLQRERDPRMRQYLQNLLRRMDDLLTE